MTRNLTETVRRFTARATTPEGGAAKRLRLAVRGCLLGLFLAAPVQAEDGLPSGQSVSLMEVRQDELGSEIWLRFRFLAPEIARDGGTVSFSGAEADMAHLCASTALPYIDDQGVTAGRIVISLSDRAVPFGESDPEATQYFDVFVVKDGRCIWEGL